MNEPAKRKTTTKIEAKTTSKIKRTPKMKTTLKMKITTKLKRTLKMKIKIFLSSLTGPSHSATLLIFLFMMSHQNQDFLVSF